jgi:hypothetical protein
MAYEGAKARETLGEFAAKQAIEGGLDLGYGVLGKLATRLMGLDEAEKGERQRDLELIAAQIQKYQSEAALARTKAELYEGRHITTPLAVAETGAAGRSEVAKTGAVSRETVADTAAASRETVAGTAAEAKKKAARIAAEAKKKAARIAAQAKKDVAATKAAASAADLERKAGLGADEQRRREEFLRKENDLDRKSRESVATLRRSAAKPVDEDILSSIEIGRSTANARRQEIATAMTNNRARIKAMEDRSSESGVVIEDAPEYQGLIRMNNNYERELVKMQAKSAATLAFLEIAQSWSFKGWDRNDTISIVWGGKESQLPVGFALSQAMSDLQGAGDQPDFVRQLKDSFLKAKIVLNPQ